MLREGLVIAQLFESHLLECGDASRLQRCAGNAKA
jgi:hypothetical protein